MTFSFEKWDGWDVVKCINGELELIIGISAGPRILSVRRMGKKNLLYKDITDFKIGDWSIYGGHRFTLAPETTDSYYPDNDICEVRIVDSELIITSKERLNGIILSTVISKINNGRGFNIGHILKNKGKENWIGALWAITCVPRWSKILAYCDSLELNYWPKTDPEDWYKENNCLMVNSGSFRGKVGWHSNFSFLATLQKNSALFIYCPEQTLSIDCVDDGSNVEVFACSDFIELETLGRIETVEPGKSVQHLQEWYIY